MFYSIRYTCDSFDLRLSEGFKTKKALNAKVKLQRKYSNVKKFKVNSIYKCTWEKI